MRALSVEELGFVSGGSVEGPAFRGGGVPYAVLGGELETVVVWGSKNSGGNGFDASEMIEQICTGIGGAVGMAAGSYLGGIAGVPTGAVLGAFAGGAIVYDRTGGTPIGAIVGGVFGLYAGGGAGAIAGALTGGALGGSLGAAAGYAACTGFG